MKIEVIIAGILSGIIGAMGLGGGGVLLIYLTVFASYEQLQAQGINLLFFIPSGLIAIIIYSIRKQIEWKVVFKMWFGGAVGAVLGYITADIIGAGYLSKVFAIFLILFGVSQLFAKNNKTNKA